MKKEKPIEALVPKETSYNAELAQTQVNSVNDPLQRLASTDLVELEDYQEAGELLVRVVGTKKRVEALEKEGLSKVREMERYIKNLFGPMKVVLMNGRSVIEGKLEDFRQLEEKAQDHEAEKVWKKDVKNWNRAKAKKGAEPELDDYLETYIPPKVEGISVRKILDYTVEDANKIPDDYFRWELDTTKVRKDLKDGVRIPGIKKGRKISTAVRS